MTYAAAWAGATSLAVLLVWFGARPVLQGAVFGPPPARSMVGRPSGPPPSTANGQATGRPTRRATGRPAERIAPRRGGRTASRPPATPSPAADARSYALTGGRVVLSVTATSARLVSATPAPGYEVRTWHATGWLRVDFAKDGRTSSLFATWNGHPPSVQVTG